MEKEKIAKKTLEFLFSTVKSIEHLDLIDDTIEDYKEEFGHDLNEYQARTRELREGYWGLKSENTRKS